MKDDPLLRYFNILRTQVEKEGLPKPIFADVVFFQSDEVVATGYLSLGEDEHGVWVSGRIDDGPEGRVSKEEIEQATHFHLRNFRLPDPPDEHLGVHLVDARIEHLGALYLSYLRTQILEAAREKFLHPTGS
jgi:hypothetical protein